ncbi:MAG: hypothetical protein HOP27_03075 [Anaerolineales bacterium]|nr:hypothetical protein [Anaerolineales bacterium]
MIQNQRPAYARLIFAVSLDQRHGFQVVFKLFCMGIANFFNNRIIQHITPPFKFGKTALTIWQAMNPA